MTEFDLDFDQDKIGHLFVVDIKFNLKTANEKQLFSKKCIHLYLKKKCCLRMEDLLFNYLAQ